MQDDEDQIDQVRTGLEHPSRIAVGRSVATTRQRDQDVAWLAIPAPNFKLVAQPNDWEKQAKAATSASSLT